MQIEQGIWLTYYLELFLRPFNIPLTILRKERTFDDTLFKLDIGFKCQSQILRIRHTRYFGVK